MRQMPTENCLGSHWPEKRLRSGGPGQGGLGEGSLGLGKTPCTAEMAPGQETATTDYMAAAQYGLHLRLNTSAQLCAVRVEGNTAFFVIAPQDRPPVDCKGDSVHS